MKGKTMQTSKRVGLIKRVAVVFGAFALCSAAHAEYVQCETPFTAGAPFKSLMQHGANVGSSLDSTKFVWGTDLNVNTLSLPSAGTVSIKLQDFAWPEALETMTLLVTDLHGIWERLDGSGSLTVDVTGATKLFTAVFARSSADSLGLYNLNASFTPVPLPAAAWLLLSGLGGLGLFRRKAVAMKEG